MPEERASPWTLKLALYNKSQSDLKNLLCCRPVVSLFDRFRRRLANAILICSDPSCTLLKSLIIGIENSTLRSLRFAFPLLRTCWLLLLL